MQGWFKSTFRGKKQEIEYLLVTINELAQNDRMFQSIQQLIEFPNKFNQKLAHEMVEIKIGMSSTGNINWFDTDSYFYTLANLNPQLELTGFFEYLDFGGITNYYSASGSKEIIESEEFEADSINVQLILECCEENCQNIKEELQRYIPNEENRIIQQINVSKSENSIILEDSFFDSTDIDPSSFINFKKDMLQLCSKISSRYPSTQLNGYFNIDDSQSCTGNEFDCSVFSKSGEATCYYADDDELLEASTSVLLERINFGSLPEILPNPLCEHVDSMEFDNKIFVLTGFGLLEKEYTKWIEERKGIVKSSTVLLTTYLIMADDYQSKKYQRAIELINRGKNIKIVSKEQLDHFLFKTQD